MPSPSKVSLVTLTPAPARPQAPRSRSGESQPTRPQAEPLGLLLALQRSLEPEVVVETFVDRLRQRFAVDGATFDHPEHGREWGAKGAHAFAARLKLDGAALGKLELYRRQAFGCRERDELSALAELLLHPLRNALTHACLQKQAFADGLTGLLNRQALDRMLPRELAAADRQGRPLTLVMIDLDHLKPINDTWGHAAGDRALQAMAGAISGSLRQSDLAFRLGGDEFMLLLPATGEAGAMTVVERIRETLSQAAEQGGAGPHSAMAGERVSFSAGIAASIPGMAAADLIEQADRAMYRAKQAGRNHHGAAAPIRSRRPAPGFSAERIATPTPEYAAAGTHAAAW
jgi:diguanylate cyclase (GGDEF)-like protein